MVKAILFDLDGTLVDTLPLYLKSYRLALKEQGFNLTDREIVDICFSHSEEIICNKLGIPEKHLEFRNTYFGGVLNHFTEGKLFNGVIKCLNLAQKKHLKLGIISFAYNWYVLEMVKKINLTPYFQVIIGFNDVKEAKPKPEAVILACNKLNILPKESMMVGDSRGDILMGQAAGSKTTLFYSKGYELFYDLKTLKACHPNNIISHFNELIALI